MTAAQGGGTCKSLERKTWKPGAVVRCIAKRQNGQKPNARKATVRRFPGSIAVLKIFMIAVLLLLPTVALAVAFSGRVVEAADGDTTTNFL